MTVCPTCQTEYDSEGGCLICENAAAGGALEPAPHDPPGPLRCSPFGFTCLIISRYLVQIVAVIYLFYGVRDFWKGNLLQLLLLPALLFLAVTLCTVLGLAIHYAEGRDPSEDQDDS